MDTEVNNYDSYQNSDTENDSNYEFSIPSGIFFFKEINMII